MRTDRTKTFKASANKITAGFAVVMLALLLLFLLNGASAAADDFVMPDNGIPVIILNIDESQGTIESMNDSQDHSVYCYGSLDIEVPEGFHYSDFPDLSCESMENLSMSIRGRGNSTWQASDKKPYKIKLDSKTDIFGLGKNKHWVLVANAFDGTQMRDRITAWLGDEMKFEFTPRGVPVDVVMTGEQYGTHYIGAYYLSENVRVDSNRLDIDELSEEDTELPAISGGYLVQNGVQVNDNSPDKFWTTRGVCWATDTPSFDTEEVGLQSAGVYDEGNPDADEVSYFPELEDAYKNQPQMDYIHDYVQLIEDTLCKEGTAYRDLMDMESAAKYWLVQEFSLNGDAYSTGSTYFYKKRDADGATGKIFWGPLWDFDYAWDHQVKTEGFTDKHYWIKAMLHDTEEGGFVDEIKKQWVQMKPKIEALIEEGGVIDQYAAETKKSAEADSLIYNPDEEFNYQSNVEQLKEWIRLRLEWFDEHLSDLDNFIRQVSFVVDGEVYENVFTENGEPLDKEIAGILLPEKEGFVFSRWIGEDGETFDMSQPINQDMTVTAEFLPEEDAVVAEDIVFRTERIDIPYNFFRSSHQLDYSIFPSDADDTLVKWSSSDENFATVSPTGEIRYKGVGEATITATLRSGKSKSILFSVSDDELTGPDAIFSDKELLELQVGEQDYFTLRTDPEKVQIDYISYESEDESVATVDDFGIVTAVGPGETRILVTTVTYRVPKQTAVTVVVTEPVEPAEYMISSGGNSSWKRGSNENVTITVKRSVEDESCFAHFTAVKIDGNELKQGEDYTAKQGSTIVTLLPAALEKLSDGAHEISVLFDDGMAAAKLTVISDSAPATGDQTHPWIWISLLILSGLTAALIIVFRRKSTQ